MGQRAERGVAVAAGVVIAILTVAALAAFGPVAALWIYTLHLWW